MYHTIIRAAFVCLFVCSLSPPRSFDGSSPNFVAVCGWTSHLPLRGSFSKRSTGQRVTFTFHYIIYAPASRHTAAKGAFCFAAAAAESNLAPFAALHLNGVCRWTSQLPLRVFFSKRSTGRRVNGSLSLSLYYVWWQTTPGSRHPAAKSTRRMMTPGSRHTTAKSTQCLLLAPRVNFLVILNSLAFCQLYYATPN